VEEDGFYGVWALAECSPTLRQISNNRRLKEFEAVHNHGLSKAITAYLDHRVSALSPATHVGAILFGWTPKSRDFSGINDKV
jgi:hypothetical protein